MIWFAAAAISTTMKLERQCGKCKRQQIVPRAYSGKTVTCHHCKAPIPPPDVRAKGAARKR